MHMKQGLISFLYALGNALLLTILLFIGTDEFERLYHFGVLAVELLNFLL